VARRCDRARWWRSDFLHALRTRWSGTRRRFRIRLRDRLARPTGPAGDHRGRRPFATPEPTVSPATAPTGPDRGQPFPRPRSVGASGASESTGIASIRNPSAVRAGKEPGHRGPLCAGASGPPVPPILTTRLGSLLLERAPRGARRHANACRLGPAVAGLKRTWTPADFSAAKKSLVTAGCLAAQ